MALGIGFFISNILLGVGLAMDAFSVSLANGLNEPGMKRSKMVGVAGIFALFQGLMPMIGWLCVHSITQCFQKFEILIPWIALVLLVWIGGNMIYDGIKDSPEESSPKRVGFNALLLQGIATSIDALSVGFTIATYDLLHALLAVMLIGAVTFLICFAGIAVGKKAGMKLAGKAGILGGLILIFIGIEIFLTDLL